MTSPSMVHRSGDTLVVRSVVSGDALYQDGENPDDSQFVSILAEDTGVTGNNNDVDEDDLDLPQCKIKRNYTCIHCEFFSQNPRSYLYHLKDIHKQKIRVYECPSCLYASKHSQKLQRHVHMVHVMNKRGKQKAATATSTAKKKPKKAQVMVTIPQTSSVLDLSENQLEAKPTDAALTVGPGELLTCSICGFATRNVNAMGRHEKLVHLKKRFFRCNKCNYVTHMRARYTKHVKYHSMPMIKCDLCDFRTPYKWNLDRHYKNHQGDGAYKCSLCNFTADIKQSLTVHEMNHHVPPVGQVAGAGVGRRRNKVGASDSMAQEQEIDQEEMELLRMERENDEDVDNNAEQSAYFQVSDFEPTTTSSTSKSKINNANQNANRKNVMGNQRKTPKIKISFKKLKASASNDSINQSFHTGFIHSDDVNLKNGNIYNKTIKCRVCNYQAAWDGEIARHELKAHGLQRPVAVKKVPRPIPNLIPIQNKTTSPPPSLPILKIPSIRSRSGPVTLKQVSQEHLTDADLSEKDLNEICAKSCPNSSLRDFASLMGGDSFSDEQIFSEMGIKIEQKSDDETKLSQASPDAKTSTTSTTTFKKKNASFFDKLKEKLMVTSGETCNLTCWCGHESKCLSELMRHQKHHNEGKDNINKGNKGTILTAGAELSSTRCQHCRQRCKTSSDLVNHLQSCPEANKTLNSSHEEIVEEVITIEKGHSEPEEEAKKVEEVQGPHPMENKVFVWNSMPQPQEAECEEECLQQMPPVSVPNEEDSQDVSVLSEESLVGIETAPGYGAVTTNTSNDGVIDSQADGKPVKKVFKCPHCTFWASTASRFHVHIVGHLNKKPFECSLCAYRSNWRWDITKHIRLKSARDVNHETAGVLMTDETGRRNYSKYNKYLTLMRVHEPTAESSGSGRRSKGMDATQGKQLPSPPRLTRAPSPQATVVRPTGTGPLRPPPPLRAAHHILFPEPSPMQSKKKKTVKRPARGIFDTESSGPVAKRPIVEGKKTLWKCKKCNFRDARRELVLAHVKEHYHQRDLQQVAATDTIAGEASVWLGQSPFRCGHCHQVSNWKHVIQRHCRLKHSGDVRVVRGNGSKVIIEDSAVEETSAQETTDADGTIQCEICPFNSVSSSEMATHKEHHSSWPGAIYKCTFCLYFVSLKKDLMTHLRLHGLTEPEEYFTKVMQGKQSQNQSSENEAEEVDQQQQNSIDSGATKRYKCVYCPYVSNSKSQFLYHKQFHRPRGAPFKCGLCSYNVTRRHLLHQHLRVHGIVIPPQKSPMKHPVGGFTMSEEGADEIEEVTEMSPPQIEMRTAPELDTRSMTDIPLVWVSRGTKFFKMYKCRFCPHVNVRKANIHEHEKMHSVRAAKSDQQLEIKKEPGTASQSLPQQHYCPDCNYICQNAGVLSSHSKVHQGMYGHVHCLVDASRSDEAQLQELAAGDSQDDQKMDDEESKQPMEIQNDDSARDYTVKDCDNNTDDLVNEEKDTRLLYFCSHCPARFLFEKELSIHIRFHEIRLLHRCESCSYTARQRPHLLAHLKVHTEEYQKRTTDMVALYQASTQHPRPRTAVIVEGLGMQGPVWVVIGGGIQHQTNQQSSIHDEVPVPRKLPSKQYSCNLCPASFFKSMALQYHMTLHNGTGPHKCRYCDYAVKTYGNLVKHEMIHNKGLGKGKALLPSPAVPISGTDLFQHKVEAQKNDGFLPRNNYVMSSYLQSPTQLHIDPQFGILMHGNPEYVYPTYFKNGRLKEKRYKCHKCPSAFEKREQYKVHLSLHGSKQRYKCEKCDYSVKYYANYIQHMRKHQSNDEATVTRKSELSLKDLESSEQEMEEKLPTDVSSVEKVQPTVPSFRSAKTICASPAINNGPLQLSVADRQSLMLLQLKRATTVGNSCESEETKKSFWCPYCPYSSQRRDGVESHVKRHEAVSGVRGAFVCDHCDYSVPQQHFLREHNKVHFTSFKKQPEAFMKCSHMELWVQNQGKENITGDVTTNSENENLPEKTIVFKDQGSVETKGERFYPLLPPGSIKEETDDGEKKYMDVFTGEPIEEDPLKDNVLDCLDKENKDSESEPGMVDFYEKVDHARSTSYNGSDTEIESGAKIFNDNTRSSSSLISGSMGEDSQTDLISESDTNDYENNEMQVKTVSEHPNESEDQRN